MLCNRSLLTTHFKYSSSLLIKPKETRRLREQVYGCQEEVSGKGSLGTLEWTRTQLSIFLFFACQMFIFAGFPNKFWTIFFYFLCFISSIIYIGLPSWLGGKESACWCRRHGFSPWEGKILWRRKWQLTPIFLPGKSHGQRSLATGHGVTKIWTWLSD